METWLLPALLGVGLAASSGLRTFLPLLALAMAAKFHMFGIELNAQFAWLGSTVAVAALALATVIELIADKIPLVDHTLGLVGNVSRPLAGAVVAGAVFARVDPATAVIAGLILGAPTAFAFHAAQAGTRGASTATTAGVANPILSVVEDVLAILTVMVAFVAPLLIPVMLGLVLWAVWGLFRLIRRKLSGGA